MRHYSLFLLFFSAAVTVTGSLKAQNNTDQTLPGITENDWPWWRGPHRDGIANAKQNPPTKWSETENIAWKVPVPGRGHGSPTVVGDHVYLATAEHDKEIQSVLCFDRKTGKQLWMSEIHRGGFEKKGNAKASLASCTIACDGSRLFVSFINNNVIYTTALDRDGKLLWQKKISDYVLHQGYGASPAIYGSLVIVAGDNKGGGAIVALERENGKEVWRHERPKLPNYPSPSILRVAGRDQLIMIGCDLVTSLEPLTGKKNWEIPGATTECVITTVTDGQHIYTSGGYPKNHISAVKADGSGKIAWENGNRVYVPSMIVKDGYLFAVLDAGIAMCWKADTGKEMWKGRLGGTFTASPVLVGDRFFATNEAGRTFIFKASTRSLEIETENQLGNEVFATPIICGDSIYMRVANTEKGQRQEFLYCIQKKVK